VTRRGRLLSEWHDEAGTHREKPDEGTQSRFRPGGPTPKRLKHISADVMRQGRRYRRALAKRTRIAKARHERSITLSQRKSAVATIELTIRRAVVRSDSALLCSGRAIVPGAGGSTCRVEETLVEAASARGHKERSRFEETGFRFRGNGIPGPETTRPKPSGARR
jgi:hypothetical protein